VFGSGRTDLYISKKKGRHGGSTPVIPAAQEVEIRRIMV
jgi:precorrin-6x reductase